MSMRFLVLESDPGVASEIDAALRADGRQVVRCHEVGAPAFPCNGIDAPCPIDAGVAAAVVVRSPARPSPTAYEDGVACALRARVPLVVASPGPAGTYDRYATEVIPSDDADAVVAALARAATARSASHEEQARVAIASVLDRRRGDGQHVPEADDVAVVVRRRADGTLAVGLQLPEEAPPGLESELAHRVHAALRRWDHGAARIDVGVTDVRS
jgi:hypothetical protein